MATDSSIHAWKIPWTEDPGGLAVQGIAKSWTRLSHLSSLHFTSLYFTHRVVVLVVKNPPANAGDIRDGLIPGSGRSPGGGNGNPFQYSCLENPMDRGTWWATVHGVAKSQT